MVVYAAHPNLHIYIKSSMSDFWRADTAKVGGLAPSLNQTPCFAPHVSLNSQPPFLEQTLSPLMLPYREPEGAANQTYMPDWPRR